MEIADPVQVAGIVVVFGGASAALYRGVIRPFARVARQAAMFFSDWFGEPARDGVSVRHGVMERLASIERKTERAEFHLGNGNPKPLREIVEENVDRLDRIEGNQGSAD